jgi:hypothetical protein
LNVRKFRSTSRTEHGSSLTFSGLASAHMGPLVVRQEVLEFGSSPVSPWLNQVESLSAIRAILEELLRSSTTDDRGRSEWEPYAKVAPPGSEQAVPAPRPSPNRF